MHNENLLNIFNESLKGPWKTSGKDVQWKTNTKGQLFFQYTKSLSDWYYNLKAMPAPYKDTPYTWYCHKGYGELWASVKDELQAEFKNTRPSLIVGFSQGGALATLAHEMFYWLFLESPKTIIFGSPRVIWRSKGVDKRFKELHNIRMRGDLVPHFPPSLFGYHAVGTKHVIGAYGIFSKEKHSSSEYRKALISNKDLNICI